MTVVKPIGGLHSPSSSARLDGALGRLQGRDPAVLGVIVVINRWRRWSSGWVGPESDTEERSAADQVLVPNQ
jgi:hypothetical protein